MPHALTLWEQKYISISKANSNLHKLYLHLAHTLLRLSGPSSSPNHYRHSLANHHVRGAQLPVGMHDAYFWVNEQSMCMTSIVIRRWSIRKTREKKINLGDTYCIELYSDTGSGSHLCSTCIKIGLKKKKKDESIKTGYGVWVLSMYHAYISPI